MTKFQFNANETAIITTALSESIAQRASDAADFEDAAEESTREAALIELLTSALASGSPVTLNDAAIDGLWNLVPDTETALRARLRAPLGGGPVKLPTRKSRKPERAEFLADIITGATEGGIGYWSQVSNYRWWSPDLNGGTAEHLDGIANAYVTIHETGDFPDEPNNKIRDIGVEDIARALGLLRNGPLEGVSDAWRKAIGEADRENDAGELDAGDYDAIVQVAMFGKVVYG